MAALLTSKPTEKALPGSAAAVSNDQYLLAVLQSMLILLLPSPWIVRQESGLCF